MPAPRTVHDFSGFPKELFEFEYPARGDPALARRLRDLLVPLEVALDEAWGLDHGTWSVLAHLFPDADVPVVQLSVDYSKPAAFHYDIGTQLRRLRDDGVLVLGSGNVVHNLRAIDLREGAPAYDWARRFSDEVRQRLTEGDHAALVEYETLGSDARLAIPTPDHYLPLLYVMGARQEREEPSFPVDGIDGRSIGMLAVLFEPRAS
jgi:4,5-DOPA dioxygenase extradiol